MHLYPSAITVNLGRGYSPKDGSCVPIASHDWNTKRRIPSRPLRLCGDLVLRERNCVANRGYPVVRGEPGFKKGGNGYETKDCFVGHSSGSLCVAPGLPDSSTADHRAWRRQGQDRQTYHPRLWVRRHLSEGTGYSHATGWSDERVGDHPDRPGDCDI
jgi:hypothetical protein